MSLRFKIRRGIVHYKGTTGTSMITRKIKDRNTSKGAKSCKNCILYSDKWCKGFDITCSSLANARNCKKFENKYGEQKAVGKSVKCSTCEFIYFDTVQSGKSRKKQHCIYKCSKRNRQIAYDKTGLCDKYKKKKEEAISIGKIYKKDSDEYKKLMAEMEVKQAKVDKQSKKETEIRTVVKCKICGREHSYKGDIEKATQSFNKGHLLKTHKMTPEEYEITFIKNKLIIK